MKHELDLGYMVVLVSLVLCCSWGFRTVQKKYH